MNVVRKKTKKFQYRSRSPYVMYMHFTEYEMRGIDHFLDLTASARKSWQQDLEQLAVEASNNVPDDWLVDDFAQIDEFASLSAEFAIVGLWRCYRTV